MSEPSRTIDGRPELRPDEHKAVDFLLKLFGDERFSLVAMDPNGGPRAAATFDQSSRSNAAGFIEAHNLRGRNLYFTPNRPKGWPTKKIDKDGVEAARCMYLDNDPLDGEDPLQCQERVLATSHLFEHPATATWRSGYGIQRLWRLRQPVLLDGKDGPATRDIESRNLALEKIFQADPCRNTDRVLRVPWTINWPNKKKRDKGRMPVLSELIELDPSRTYDLADFPSAEASTSTPTNAEILLLPASAHAVNIDVRTHPKLLALGEEAHNRFIAIVEGNFTPEYEFQNDRSRAVLYVACEALRAGLEPGEIVGLLLNRRHRISDHLYDRGGDVFDYARRQVARASNFVALDAEKYELVPKWTALKKDKTPASTLENTEIAIQALNIVCRHDEFRDRYTLNGHSIGEKFGELSDRACIMLRRYIIKRFRFDPGRDHVLQAASGLCLENAYDPIKDFLDGLVWDGVPRLDTWLIKYAGAEDTPYNRMVGRKFLVAGVRRVRLPGSKFDYMPVLEGSQGSGKSTLLRILAGDEYFSDQEIMTIDERAQQELLKGKWIYEISELVGLKKADTERIKAFISRQEDRARPAYGRTTVDAPRRVVLVGTTNQAQYLRDPTGNRRFWPVKTGKIDIACLQRDRAQLWAEAAMIEAAGEVLTLPPELLAEAQAAQRERLSAHPWTELLINLRGEPYGDQERISSTQILRDELRLNAAQCTPQAGTDLKAAMHLLGWEGPKKMRFRAGTMNGYYRPLTRERMDEEDAKPPF